MGEEILPLQQGNQIPSTVIPRYNSDLILINTGPVGDCDDQVHIIENVARTKCDLPSKAEVYNRLG